MTLFHSVLSQRIVLSSLYRSVWLRRVHSIFLDVPPYLVSRDISVIYVHSTVLRWCWCRLPLFILSNFCQQPIPFRSSSIYPNIDFLLGRAIWTHPYYESCVSTSIAFDIRIITISCS